ncbi:MAG: c-type cytochrome [Acidobacteriota bacterium]
MRIESRISTNQARRIWACGATLTLALGWLSPRPATAQPPEKFENLQVLPQDIPPRELMGVMRAFSMGLGVRCQHCHVGDEAKQKLWDFDFISDEKESKKTARLMLQMMREINGTHLAKLGEASADRLEVQCVTCHRGQARPVSLARVLAEAVEAAGVDAGMAKYAELREQYYGSHTYDFSERALRQLARRLQQNGKPEAAITFLELNLEHFPDALASHVALGDLRARVGDRAAARRSYEKALELSPGASWLQQKLADLDTSE